MKIFILIPYKILYLIWVRTKKYICMCRSFYNIRRFRLRGVKNKIERAKRAKTVWLYHQESGQDKTTPTTRVKRAHFHNYKGDIHIIRASVASKEIDDGQQENSALYFRLAIIICDREYFVQPFIANFHL